CSPDARTHYAVRCASPSASPSRRALPGRRHARAAVPLPRPSAQGGRFAEFTGAAMRSMPAPVPSARSVLATAATRSSRTLRAASNDDRLCVMRSFKSTSSLRDVNGIRPAYVEDQRSRCAPMRRGIAPTMYRMEFDKDQPAVGYERHGEVLVLALVKPEKLNTWDSGMRMRVGELLQEADAEPAVRAIVLTGTGEP